MNISISTYRAIYTNTVSHVFTTGSKESEVLGVGSIPIAILLSCQYRYVNNISLTWHRYEYNWVVKIRNTSEAVFRPQYTPWPLC